MDPLQSNVDFFFLQVVDYVYGIFTANVLDTKFIDSEGGLYGSGYML